MKFLLLLVLIKTIFISATDDCYFSSNNFIRIYPNKTTENVRAYLAGYSGYSALSFSTSTSTRDVFFTVVLWQKESEISNIGFIKSNNFTFIEEFNQTKSTSRERGRILFRVAFLTIPQEFLEHKFFLVFRNNYETPPVLSEGGWKLTAFPEEISIKSLEFPQSCLSFTCDSDNRYRLLPISLIQVALQLVLIVLTLFAQNWQPMKSRGISLFIGLIYNTIGGSIDLIPFIIPGYTIELAHTYDIYLTALLQIPIDFTIRIIIFCVGFYD
jgi:hypothetical protein